MSTETNGTQTEPEAKEPTPPTAPPADPPQPETSDEALQRILNQKKAMRARACAEEIEALQKKYRCRIVAVPFLTPDGRIDARTNIIAE